ncbi:hypothetical protein DL93DRAFT_2088145 [Clavulina sp. PMI_390]|nr:hypothetical protein DL93DRAFT_2088145 [Clavulina sp. PMI_390]
MARPSLLSSTTSSFTIPTPTTSRLNHSPTITPQCRPLRQLSPPSFPLSSIHLSMPPYNEVGFPIPPSVASNSDLGVIHAGDTRS